MLTLFIAVAGCASKDASTASTSASPLPSAAPSASSTADTGGIEGTITDDEQKPIPGADVALVGKNQQTKTALDGRFSFSDLAPDSYAIAVAALGFDAASKKVAVVAGEVATVTFVLKPVDLNKDPVIEMVPKKGYINCSLNPYYSANVCGNVAQDQAHFPFKVREDLKFKELIVEMSWTPGSAATGQILELNVCDRIDNQTNQANCLTRETYYKYTSGVSPRTIRDDKTPVKDLKDYQISVGAGQLGAGPAGSVPVAFQQNFDVYLTVCYVQKCPDEYTALPPK